MSFFILYRDVVVPKLMEEYNYKSSMAVPRISKITLNMGLGEAVSDKKILEKAALDLGKISLQKPLITKARKSVAGFKIREGWPIGCKVTLRDKNMWSFLERLVCIAIPRIRDFRGFSSSSFDGRGNYNLGITEQIVFSEIDYDSIDKIRGLDINISTTAKNDREGISLLKSFNFPLKD